MAIVRMKYRKNTRGLIELMNRSSVQSACLEKAQSIASAAQSASGAGSEYSADVQPGKNRCHALAKTENYKARIYNHKRHALLRALCANYGRWS